MEIIKPGVVINFMRYRAAVITASLVLAGLSLGSLFFPGPNYGIDFQGGTELQLRFSGDVQAAELRGLLQGFGYDRPDVVRVEGEGSQYILRVKEVSALPESKVKAIRASIESNFAQAGLSNMKVSPGGDKITLRFDASVDEAALQQVIRDQAANVQEVRRFGKRAHNRYEVHLAGVGQEVVRQLRTELGARGPSQVDRVEWVGPKAGKQLRDAAIKSLLFAIAFIMVYVAFRFDLRFAPGGVLAMMHDALITLGVYVLVRKEMNLTTIAALLTIIGYSINDTIVVFDRIRENMARHRDKSMVHIINVSTSQMLSRTIVTSGTTLLSVSAFFIFGTPVIKDIAFALVIGIFIGTYSSIYIAAPVTEWMDRKFFRGAR